MRVLIPGGYGLIGAAIARHLSDAGHEVTVMGRSAQSAKRVLPHLPFVPADIAQMTTCRDWALLSNHDAVVNCSGALQDSPGDDLNALHSHAVQAMGRAAAVHKTRVIQISAAGACPDAPTDFMRSKATGDAALLASQAHVTILRPGLVIDQSAYGGSLLLRMLAAVPVVQPIALPDAPVQCVSTGEISQAVVSALAADFPSGQTLDLVENHPRALREVIALHRRALGFAPARYEIIAPDWLTTLSARASDALAHLGWRSPLRSNAMASLQSGITGDPEPWRGQGTAPRDLPETLNRLQLGSEHRMRARTALLMPVCVAGLAVFWILSGIIGALQLSEAAQHLTRVGWNVVLAQSSVLFWALVDVALGLAVLYRPTAQKACLGMMATCALYVTMGTLVTPALWADPLGPMVKILPAFLLAAATYPMLEPR
ncbi:MAG: SDR family oxidoreductase [Pelagimonas sp.]|jgi:uncharacterized protein YbjT (DUF2867 family)|nr:SDR family oxidoreductase [Pelagimonas sp.]